MDEGFRIKTRKNKIVLMVNHFIHRIVKKRDENEYFKCIDNCGGRFI